MSSVAGDAQLARSASTLRIFQNTTRKLVHFGPSNADSMSLFLHSTITFACFLLLMSLSCLGDQGSTLGLKSMWGRLKQRFDESTPLMICLMLNAWLIGFSLISLTLYYKYEKDTEIRYADDVIMVDNDVDPVASSNDNPGSNKSGSGLFGEKLEGTKIMVVRLPTSTSNGLERGGSGAVAIGLSGN